MVGIPEELQNKKQWSYSFSSTERKRPKHFHYRADAGLTFVDAVQTIERLNDSHLLGFYVTKEDPYILLDIDDLKNPNNPFEELPPNLSFLLKTKETYSEISPSGSGIRVFLKFISNDIKQQLQGNIYKAKEYQEPFKVIDKNGKEKVKVRDIHMNIGPPWMTITTDATEFAKKKVGVVSVDELEKCFNIKRLSTVVEQASSAAEKMDLVPIKGPLPSFFQIEAAIMSLPLDQNLRIQRAYFKTFNVEYEHYDYWLKVLMGLHHYASLVPAESIKCLELIMSWSRLDSEAFVSDEDVHRHWASLTTNQQIIVTYKSLLSLSYYNTLIWPIIKTQKQDEIERGLPPKPLTTEYVNFRALLDYYNINLHRDETNINVIYLSGDVDIIEKEFKLHRVNLYYDKYYGPYDEKTLIPGFHMFSQKYGFLGVSHIRIKEFVRDRLAETTKTINLLKLYFDTPFDQLPKAYQENGKNYSTSTVKALFDCLEIQPITTNAEEEYTLYWRYYKCWLMGIVRVLYYDGPYTMNNSILLLTGPEQIRKTSHFLSFFPSFMKEKIALTTHGFQFETSMRDLIKLSTNHLLIFWDEIEQYLNVQSESNFKKVLDNNVQTIIDKWEVTERKLVPIAIYGATSNQREFKLGDEGSRRIFHIPVKHVNTEKMNTLCWHSIINELKADMLLGLKQNKIPWLLNKDELKKQAELHTYIKTKNDIDLILEEIYEFDYSIEYTSVGGIKGVTCFQNDRTGTFKSISAILNDLSSHGYDRFNIKRSALQKALSRLCGSYTKTTRERKHLQYPLCEIYKGLATQGRTKYWTMPPLRRNLAREVFAHVTDSLT